MAFLTTKARVNLPPCSDYATNEALDRYSDADLDDQVDIAHMTAAQRRAAEAKMARRDKVERQKSRGGRAARRSRYPGFLESDDDMEDEELDGGILSGAKRRTRRQYDERRDMDDLEGVEDVRNPSPFFAQKLNLFDAGDTLGAAERYQGEVYRRMDCERTRQTFHYPSFPPIPDDIRGRQWELCVRPTYSQSRRK